MGDVFDDLFGTEADTNEGGKLFGNVGDSAPKEVETPEAPEIPTETMFDGDIKEPPPSPPSVKNYEDNSSTRVIKRTGYTFYTGTSSLRVTVNEKQKAVFFEIAPSVGERKYDYNRKITTKMNEIELAQMLHGIHLYNTKGVKGFMAIANLFSKGKDNSRISFYHKTDSSSSTITLFVNNAILCIGINKDGNKILFPILPAYSYLLEVVLETYLRVLLLVEEEIKLSNKPPQQSQRSQQGQPSFGDSMGGDDISFDF